MRILVAGGAGYVGSTSVEAFLAAGHHVVVYDDLSTGHAASVIKPARLVRGSARTGRAWRTCCATSGSRPSCTAPPSRWSARAWSTRRSTTGTTSPAGSRS